MPLGWSCRSRWRGLIGTGPGNSGMLHLHQLHLLYRRLLNLSWRAAAALGCYPRAVSFGTSCVVLLHGGGGQTVSTRHVCIEPKAFLSATEIRRATPFPTRPKTFTRGQVQSRIRLRSHCWQIAQAQGSVAAYSKNNRIGLLVVDFVLRFIAISGTSHEF